MRTLILLSGGIDSIALAYWLRPDFALTVDYGQSSAEKEIAASSFVAAELGIHHRIVRTGTGELGSGTMSKADVKAFAPVPEWWPFRNQFLITLAAMQAIKEDCGSILIGTVNTDQQMSDGSHAFLETCSKLLALQEGALQLKAPASTLTSTELVRKSKMPLSLLMVSHSCHLGNIACGQCRGCVKHQETLVDLGIE